MAANEHLIETLKQIGLTDKEAAVYLALLSLESATAYQIALHCDVKKPTVYVILEDLRKKGLALKIPHAKKALFSARNITEYLSEQKQKIKAVEAIVPKLEALGGQARPNVYFFTGLKGTSEALDYKFDSMRGKTFCCFFGNLTESDKDQIEAFEDADKRMVAAGISFKIVMSQNEKENQKKLIALSETTDKVQIKYVSDYVFPSTVAILIGDGFVRIHQSKHITATVIDDQITADAMRQIFNIVWEKSAQIVH